MDPRPSGLDSSPQSAERPSMDIAQPPPRTAPGVRIIHAGPRVVITRDSNWQDRVYVLTAIGWRLRTHPLRDDGDLVTDPAFHAILDAAAAAT